jgi:putative sterol carrier protein
VALIAFSQEWAAAWAAALNQSVEYREAAAAWEEPVALLLDDGIPDARRAVLLDLWHGTCRSARATEPDALQDAGFVFRASSAGWRDMFSGRTSPVMALLNGKIRLARGNLAKLLPFASAAKQLLDLARGVPTHFPEG